MDINLLKIYESISPKNFSWFGKMGLHETLHILEIIMCHESDLYLQMNDEEKSHYNNAINDKLYQDRLLQSKSIKVKIGVKR